MSASSDLINFAKSKVAPAVIKFGNAHGITFREQSKPGYMLVGLSDTGPIYLGILLGSGSIASDGHHLRDFNPMLSYVRSAITGAKLTPDLFPGWGKYELELVRGVVYDEASVDYNILKIGRDEIATPGFLWVSVDYLDRDFLED